LLTDQRQQRFDVMSKKVTELLARSKTLMRELATQTDIPDQTWILVEDAKQSATGLAGVLLGMDLPPVLEACDNLHWQFVDEDKREEARLISQLTLLLLPALYDFAVVETVRGDRFNIARAIIQVPAALRTVAEIIMAGVDRRAMQVHYDPHEYFQRGTQCLPKRPEAGADESGDQSRRDFLEQITQLLTPEFDPEFMDNFRAHIVQHFAHKEPGREYSPALKTEIKSAAIILRRLAERHHQTYYYVFDMPPDPAGRQTAERVIAQLKADFPAIVFLTLTSDEGLELQEQELFAPLPDMFSRLKAT
jgi:hypothetical protein